jgi:hypothetical protein
LASAVAFHFGKGLSHAADFHHLALLQRGAAPRGTETIIVALFFFSGVQAIHAQVQRGPVAVERRADPFRFAARFGDPSHA